MISQMTEFVPMSKIMLAVQMIFRLLQIPILFTGLILQWKLRKQHAAILISQAGSSNQHTCYSHRLTRHKTMLTSMSVLCLGFSLWPFRTRLIRKDKRTLYQERDPVTSVDRKSAKSTVSGQACQLPSSVHSVIRLAEEGAETLQS